MAANLLLSVQDAYVTFGGKPLFDGLSFNIHEGDKICLIGKNGAGKTTLMQLITGERELDGGKRLQHPGVTIGYLPQEIYPDKDQTVEAFILAAVPKDREGEDHTYKVQMVMGPLELHGSDKMGTLSGGQLRRAALARALVEDPDILLLDEPTNHLDLVGIEWLEEFLNAYRGTLICVSHDRTFLSNISDKVFWLDRSRVRVCPRGFAYFEEWSAMLLEQEARELENRSKIVAQEVAWASQGVKARRKRNIRRLEQVSIMREQLKADQSQYNRLIRKIEVTPMKELEVSSHVVAEFYKVGKYFETAGGKKTILDGFSLRVVRGDRIGLLGRNGSGKTTFLRLLLGEIEPDAGKVKLARNVEISYFDQKRQELDPKKSLRETLCPKGNDYVDVAGKPRHVYGYLQDFMFDPKDAHNLVGTLSGGQRNRLMLAKVLATPGNFLILDEPTNDLDMDTLDMLEEILAKYTGTLIVVSHDRDFLDQTVTSTLAFEGGGKVESVIGGYTDYLEATGKKKPATPKPEKVEKKEKAPKAFVLPKSSSAPEPKGRRLSNKEQYELKHLPQKIKTLTDEVNDLHRQLEDADLYMKHPEMFDRASRRVARAQEELEAAELLWLELEEIREASGQD
ncbi:MAG: ABC transporter ATP-binding protein [Proteobacteria bacterium]|nr:ABC transporter ATP-binding protein [Pseudomonadota bacterium]